MAETTLAAHSTVLICVHLQLQNKRFTVTIAAKPARTTGYALKKRHFAVKAVKWCTAY